MATYYFDANGATAGFGTLTGNWNPSTALWSTSSAGTAATAAVTFTNADVAQFGFAGTTGTGGTATITTGITNTVNQVVTANLAAFQSIAGPGTLELAGTNPTINVGSAGGLAITAPIAGTGGFTKTGTGGRLQIYSGTNTLSGTVTISTASVVQLGAGGATSADRLPSVSSYISNVANGGVVFFGNTNINFTGRTFSGSGYVIINGNMTGAVGHTFPAGALAGLNTAATQGAITYNTITGTNPTSGLFLYTESGSTYGSAIVTVNDLPTTLSLIGFNTSTNTVYYTGAAATYPTKIYTGNNSVSGTVTSSFYANAGPIELQGGIERSATIGATHAMTLRGTNTATISGPILNSSVSGNALGIIKNDAGRWVFTNSASNYSGVTTITSGPLRVTGSGAGTYLGAAAATSATISTGGALELSGGVTVTKSSTAFSVTGTGVSSGGAIRSISGNNTLNASGYTLAAGSTINVEADSFTLGGAGAIIGSASLSKIGPGELILPQTANTYTGATTVSAGNLTVAKLADVDVQSSIGKPLLANATITMPAGTTLKHNGTTADTTNRIIGLAAAGSLTIDSSGTGSGAVTLSAGGSFTLPTGTNTLVFSGTNTATNTCARTVANPATGTTALTKTGSNTWEISGSPTYTGATTVSAGTLGFNSQTLSTSDVVFNGAGKLTNVILGGAKNITCNAGSGNTAELVAAANNTRSGATALNSGILRLTTETLAAGVPVKVLGDTAVTVNNGGAIRTTKGTFQLGKMHYGGNLTFKAGSSLYLG